MKKNYYAWIIIVISLFFLGNILYSANKVVIKRQKNQFQLIVNNKQMMVYGAGVGKQIGTNGDDYLKLAKELGANTVRTWGVDQGNKKYLDRAAELGLFVDAGVWLNETFQDGACSYITDTVYMDKVKKETLDYVKEFKDHPAILIWNIGNEVFYRMKKEEDKIAFAKFLNSLLKEIKKIDKNHPVMYTSAKTTGLPYIIKYVPEIDIFGINLYGGVTASIQECVKSGLNKPLMLTEIGPLGFWDRQKDTNGVHIDQSDQEKAAVYKRYMNEALRFPGQVLGLFAFHLGETTQDSLTWWNINYGSYKRAAFWEIYKIFTQDTNIRPYPIIKSFSINKQVGLNKGEWIKPDLSIVYPKPEDLSYEFFCSTVKIDVLQYYVNEKINVKYNINGDDASVQVPDKPGIYRLYVLVKNLAGSAAISSLSIKVE